jgi:hypothetical protein
MSHTRRKSEIKRKPEHDCETLQKAKRDAADGSMESLRWREMITEFQNKNMHISPLGMKLGLGGS